ncbi:MAG: hypothetical protein EBS19_11645 [Spirochaetia bacterium]|nr:hypothetical protein [Spirochaetia bacterium]
MNKEIETEDLLEINATRLKALCEAMQRKGKSTLLEEKLANILIKGFSNEWSSRNQKGAA